MTGATGGLSPHGKRWATGAAVGAPVFAVLLAGPWWAWFLLVSAGAVTGLWELFRMILGGAERPARGRLALVPGVLIPAGAALGGQWGLSAGLLVSLFLGFSFVLLREPRDPTSLTRLGLAALGWLYVPWCLSHLLLFGPDGKAWVFFTLLVVMAGDTGAFYVGRRFGRRRLYERVSPGKTLEGALGGLAGSAAVGAVFSAFLLPWGFLAGALAGLLVGAVGQVGDLVESMIKRQAGVKDSSGLLPGHGGLLDRLDSLLFALPAAWVLSRWLG